jgi:hypothetical protein
MRAQRLGAVSCLSFMSEIIAARDGDGTPSSLMASSDNLFSFLDCSGHPAATVP